MAALTKAEAEVFEKAVQRLEDAGNYTKDSLAIRHSGGVHVENEIARIVNTLKPLVAKAKGEDAPAPEGPTV